MADLSQLRTIEGRAGALSFHPETLTLLSLRKNAAEIVNRRSAGRTAEEIEALTGTPSAEIHAQLGRISDALDGVPAVRFDYAATEESAVLAKLELMISLGCNLRCRYCYADGGDYGLKTGLMRPETARAAVEAALRKYTGIESIMFFGGEPLLNQECMREVCAYVTGLHHAGRLELLPKLTLVTNGTLVTDEFAELARRYDMQVTVSVDGPERIHDRLRKRAVGGGSYADVCRGLTILRAHGLAPQYEATFTQAHVEEGVSVREVLDHLRRDLGFEDSVGSIGDADVAPGDPLDLRDPLGAFFVPLMERSMEDLCAHTLQSGQPVLDVMLAILQRKVRTHLCPAGFASIAVTPEGGIYPCHIMIKHEDFRFGHVADERWFASDAAAAVYERLRRSRKTANPYCSQCWAKPFCMGCLGEWRNEEPRSSFVNPEKCRVKRQVWDLVLETILALKSDPDKWRMVQEFVARQSAGAGESSASQVSR